MTKEISSAMRASKLRKDYYPQTEIFLPSLGDAPIKDDMASMEHPVFTLSKKPDLTVREYHHANSRTVITPSVKGHANIYDKDILIYAVSNLMKIKNEGGSISKKLYFNAIDFMKATNRANHGGSGYEQLRESLLRLKGTTVETNVTTGDITQTDGFGLIESYKVRREDISKGRVLEWSVTISDWLFNAIENNEVLTISKDYFRLSRPLERRIYEIARKHCGNQKRWAISIEKLKYKCGSQSSTKRFKQMIGEIDKFDHLPDYSIMYNGNTVMFINKQFKSQALGLISNRPETHHLKSGTLDHVSDILMRQEIRLDKYALFEQFANRVERDGQPDDLDRAFIGYVKKAAQNL